jgi:CRP-like cAMP-binding protein
MPTVSSPSGNRLLARLPNSDYEALLPHLQQVPLAHKQILYEAETPIEYAYFPTAGVLSAVTVMNDGNMIEVATVGREGMVGLPFLIGNGAPHRMIVQVPGEGLRIAANDLKGHTTEGKPLRSLLTRYHLVFFRQTAQSVACNGLHRVQQRCCRWLLETRDRVDSEDLPLTQEFLAAMLGVQRSSVNEVLHPLQEKGLVHTNRGVITILDRNALEAGACECYRSVREYFERLLG